MSKLFVNPTLFRSTADATSATSKNAAISLGGGIAVGKSGRFGGKVYATGFDAGGAEITNVGDPALDSSAATKGYVTRTTLSAESVDNYSIEMAGSPLKLRLSSTGLGAGLIGGSGAILRVDPNLTLLDAITSTFKITSTLDATTLSSAAATIAGGLAVTKSVRLGYNNGGNNLVFEKSDATPGLVIKSSGVGDATVMQLDAPTAASGRIDIVAGTAGSYFSFAQSGTSTTSPFISANTLDSSSATTGAVRIAGGLGVGKSVYVGSLYSGYGFFNSTSSTISAPAFKVELGGSNFIIYKNGTNNTVLDNNGGGGLLLGGATAYTQILNTSETTSTATGALRVAGGLAIAKNTHIGGSLVVGSGNAQSAFNITPGMKGVTATAGFVTLDIPSFGTLYVWDSLLTFGTISTENATDASSTTTGSIITPGGLGVAKTIYSAGLTTTTLATTSMTTTTFRQNPATYALPTLTHGLISSTGVGTTITNSISTSGATVDFLSVTSLGAVSMTSSNVVTYTEASTLHIAGPPTAGTNVSITNPLALRIAAGNVAIAGKIDVGSSATTQHTISASIADNDVLGVKNNNATGYSSLAFYDNTAAGKAKIGWANATASQLPGAAFFYSAGRIYLDTATNVSIVSTVESTSTTTGSLLTTGGIGVGKSLSLKGKINIFGTTSGSVSFAAPATSSGYTLTLPAALPTTAGTALVSDLTGNLTFSEVAAGARPREFIAANNVATPTNITALVVTTVPFLAYVAVNTVATVSSSGLYFLRVLKNAGAVYTLIPSLVSTDVDPGITFSITAGGQIQYTSPNAAGWTSTTFSVKEL